MLAPFRGETAYSLYRRKLVKHHGASIAKPGHKEQWSRTDSTEP